MMKMRVRVANLFVVALLLVFGCAGEAPELRSDVGGGGDASGDGSRWDIGFCVSGCEGKPCGGDDGCGGVCAVGICALGQRCDEGVCVCDGSSCPEGCCQQGECFLGSADSHCGEAGGACVDCLLIDQSCGAEQTCIACTPQCASQDCGAPNGCGGICSTGSCPTGQACSGGQCVCNATSCPLGCCRDNLCYPGSEDSHCGKSGALCADCRPSAQSCLSTQVCGCVPDCTGKACGAGDGCGGTCKSGSCNNGQVCIDGLCECNAQSCPDGCCDSGDGCQPGTADLFCGASGGACTSCSAVGLQCVDRACRDCSRWRVGPLAAHLYDSVVDGDGMVYSVGSAEGQLQLLKVDACGQIEQQRVHLGTNRSKLAGRSAIVVGSDLWVGGKMTSTTSTDPQHGYYGRYSKANLAELFGTGLHGSAGEDEVRCLVWTGSHFFMSGVSDIFGAPSHFWGLKATTSKACGFGVLPTESAVGRRARLDPSGFVYMVGGHSGFAHIARYATSSCSVDPCQPCPPPWTMEFRVDSFGTEARDVVVVGGSLYVAGLYNEAADNRQGFVAKIDIATKSVTKLYRYSPTTRHDIVQALIADSTRLYAVGGKDLGPDFLTGGLGTVFAMDLNLNKQWELAPGDPRNYWDIELAGSDGLIITGGDVSEGYVRRCLRSGEC